jgi:7-keto-8-aminopelargonate synthetase-like enzyme
VADGTSAHATAQGDQTARWPKPALSQTGRDSNGDVRKAFFGGYTCGSRALIELLINRADFIFHRTGSSCRWSAAATDPSGRRKGRRACLLQRVREARRREWTSSAPLSPENADTPNAFREPGQRHTPLIRDASKTVEAAASLRSEGVFIPAIRYPTVARGAARLRLTITAAHTTDDINQLVAALKRLDLVPDAEHEIPHSASKE